MDRILFKLKVKDPGINPGDWGERGGCYETFEDLLISPDINIDHYVYCMGVSCRHVEHYLDDLVMSKDENCQNLDLARTQHNQLKLGLR